VKAIAHAADPRAFIVSHPVADVDGGVLKHVVKHAGIEAHSSRQE
jgi:predicted RNA binding protein YcfA (HicA-like mRNA interferase family)